jgi:feruloyl esterase
MQPTLRIHPFAAACAPLAAVLLLASPAHAAPGAAACAALAGQQIANTTITGAQYVTAAGGNYCEVSATVVPQTDIKVRLPDSWERRYVQYGGSGFDGAIPNLSTGFGTAGSDPVANGFAVAANNGGHRGTDYPGASFASDRGLTLSYSVAKIYDTDLVAAPLILAYYGQPAKYRYFTGCSNGGKNASVAASNYFQRYDGVIGADGVWGHSDDNVGGADMPGLTAKWVQTLQVGTITADQAAALHTKMVQACDGLDGNVDGIVGNIGACPFKQIIAASMCRIGQTGTCLTSADVQKINALTSDYVLRGKVTGPAWSAISTLSDVSASSSALAGGFLQMTYRSATPIDPLSIDLPTQFPTIKAVLDDVYSMTGDLDGIQKYLNKGKKLMLYHGWEDTTVPAYLSVNFFNALQQADAQAGRNTRLYMAPGVGHCAGGPGADSNALLMVMAKWVEQNQEPGSAASPTTAWKAGPTPDLGSAQFSRPLCPYPTYPQYSGQGDPAQASSYACRPGPTP